jgi:hypothetical protein
MSAKTPPERSQPPASRTAPVSRSARQRSRKARPKLGDLGDGRADEGCSARFRLLLEITLVALEPGQADGIGLQTFELEKQEVLADLGG